MATKNGGGKARPAPSSPPEAADRGSTSKPGLKRTLALSLGALGIVYGDIGTSPLYAVKECFHGLHAIAITHANIVGVMSLIFWSLTMVITIKYVTFILRADNEGEGGIYALAALFLEKGGKEVSEKTVKYLAVLAIFGAALLYGDGLITPVISVLSAVEGLKVATSAADPYVLPLTCIIIFLLFMVQRHGTERIGKVFGLITIIWFLTLAVFGVMQVIKSPEVLEALDPRYAVAFFAANHLHGMVVLASVVLVITGGEALYADLGHFGRRPIQISWLAIVFPALLLNYFGQCSLLLQNPQAAYNPFYELVPRFCLYPMVGLATAATIIASQAMISGVYSLTQQAMQIGYLPRLEIVHTSGETKGQIYMPWVNTVMLIGCLGLAVMFRESSRLAAAYGIAVTGTMGITTLLYYYVARYNWNWPLWKVLIPVGVFLFFDLAYFGANMLKFVDGGWFTVSVALVLAAVMITWRDGRAVLAKRFETSKFPVKVLLEDIETYKLVRTPGAGVFLSVSPQGTPIVLLHLLKHTESLPQTVVLLSIVAGNTPFVPKKRRVAVTHLGHGFHRVIARYGFMQTPNVPEILEAARHKDLELDLYSTSFYLGRETLLSTGEGKMASWRKSLFAFLSRNSWNVSTYFGIPPNRVVELGSQVEI
ncbi:MAG: potassium transporter Kup [Syntrophales bacterium]|nr:potassium transporter Kup [Syntrophales bacterium]MDD5642435.1 potassium transporter Kup [Syntrophales bacterium]